ncbi:MAG: hypothetical protein IK143_08810 [Bacteroidales bacterium]|nr:hypothetical protein [Bacteroidales bacterium]
MKRFFLLLAVLFLFACNKEDDKSSYYNPDGSLLTWEQARDLTEDLWSAFDFAVISMDIIPPSTKIPQAHTGELYYSPSFSSWTIVMSPNPLLVNGFQIYRYVFVNAKTGEIHIDPTKREIDNETMRWRSIKLPEVPSRNSSQLPYLAKTKAEMGTKSAGNTNTSNTYNKWAVILSGGGTKEFNYYRYKNDCTAMYSILVEKYGYQKSHIYLLVSDGTSSGKDMNFGLTDDGPFYSSLLDYGGFVCNV